MSSFITPQRIFFLIYQHQAVEPGHNGEPGALVARLVEEDLKFVCAPVAQHHRAAWAAISSHSSAGPVGVQVTSFFFFF